MPSVRHLGLGLAVCGAACGLLPRPGAASTVKFLEISKREEFTAGTLDNVAVGSLGGLSLADRSERLVDIDAPFAFAAARHPRGWVVGTGNEGKVLLVLDGGGVEELLAAPEPEIFAVHVDADGTVFAASSPRGSIYRIRDGVAEVFFTPPETYVWALTRDAGGDLLVATGTEGRLYRVDVDGRATVVFDSEQAHLRSLLALPDGRILVGTSGGGQIIEILGERVRTLHDAEQPEVVALAAGPDGVVHAAMISSEASVVDAATAAAAAAATAVVSPGTGVSETPAGGSDAAAGDRPTVTVRALTGGPDSSRGRTEGPRSLILRIDGDGAVRELHRFADQTVYALQWWRDRLWIGTGLEGQLYSLQGDRLVLEKDVDEKQIIALTEDDPGPAFVTTNAAALYRVTRVSERRGHYTSATLDAHQASRFGELHWQGELPPGTRLAFSVRTGMSAEPDVTWSDWSPWREGSNVDLHEAPLGRYVQWRVRFQAAGGRSPQLRRVTLSYRHENVPPRITQLDVLDAGVVLLAPASGSRDDLYEVWSVERDGVFTGARAASGDDEQRPRRGKREGFRTFQWKGEDGNGDALRYRISFRPEGRDASWMPMAEEIEESWLAIDARVLPDGWYRTRVEAFDRHRADRAHEGASAERISDPWLNDHGAPRLVGVEPREQVLAVTVEDAWSPLRRARLSLDAGRWRPVGPAGPGFVDGLREVLAVERPPAGSTLLLLQVEDAAGNVATFDLSQWVP